MNVYIIGVGPGNGQYLIKESEEKIENADIIIGAKRLIKPYCNKKTFAAITPFDIISIIKSNNQCENIAVLMSGDASFYSGTKKLVLELEKEKIKYNILPGISSVSYMSAKKKNEHYGHNSFIKIYIHFNTVRLRHNMSETPKNWIWRI